MGGIIMKTIEERAKLASEGYDDDGYSAGLYMGYVVGAKEQKSIDDAEWLKIKSSWEREAQINHNDENNYKQGFHDAIEKACEWLRARNVLTEASIEGFRKAMQK